MTDIDIDFADREKLLAHVPFVQASRIDKGKLVKHNNGVYFQDIPTDPESGFASIPYEQAEARGWNKIDLLNVHVYEGVRDEEHLIELLNREPTWELLKSEEFVVEQQLFHLHDHFNILRQMPPSNIEQLAMVLAMRLPSKRYLVGKTWEEVEKEVWLPTNEYYFKKAHAIAYAHAVVVHMNLLIDKIMS